MTDPRRTARWQAIRAGIVTAAQAAGTPCAHCGGPIDYTASGRSRRGPSVDHETPVALDPAAALDGTGLRVVHGGCNASLGAALGNRLRRGRRAPPTPTTPDPAERWVPSRQW